jgi:hypothetical protein
MKQVSQNGHGGFSRGLLSDISRAEKQEAKAKANTNDPTTQK